ncbi:MAG: hypothetical protein QOH93_1496 [Chloroflexia bacterium]|nr:hypothetical protein [Chloroflexia bacterium]
MATEIRELEGTWEEIMEHAEELAGKRVRVFVLATDNGAKEPGPKAAKLGDLLKHAGTWQGDDFEETLQAVYDNRTQAKFD